MTGDPVVCTEKVTLPFADFDIVPRMITQGADSGAAVRVIGAAAI